MSCIFNISLCNFYFSQSCKSRHGIKTRQEIDLIQYQNIDNKFSSIGEKETSSSLVSYNNQLYKFHSESFLNDEKFEKVK